MIFCMWLVIINIFEVFLHGSIGSKGFGGAGDTLRIYALDGSLICFHEIFFHSLSRKIRNLSIVYIYDNLNSWKQHIASQCISLFQNSLLFLTFIIRDFDKSFKHVHIYSNNIYFIHIYINFQILCLANKNPKSGPTYICLPSTSQQSLSTTESQMCAQLQKEFNFQVTQNKNRYN